MIRDWKGAFLILTALPLGLLNNERRYEIFSSYVAPTRVEGGRAVYNRSGEEKGRRGKGCLKGGKEYEIYTKNV